MGKPGGKSRYVEALLLTPGTRDPLKDAPAAWQNCCHLQIRKFQNVLSPLIDFVICPVTQSTAGKMEVTEASERWEDCQPNCELQSTSG